MPTHLVVNTSSEDRVVFRVLPKAKMNPMRHCIPGWYSPHTPYDPTIHDTAKLRKLLHTVQRDSKHLHNWPLHHSRPPWNIAEIGVSETPLGCGWWAIGGASPISLYHAPHTIPQPRSAQPPCKLIWHRTVRPYIPTFSLWHLHQRQHVSSVRLETLE